MPAAPCGECKFFEEVHQITPKLSEGWCKVSSEPTQTEKTNKTNDEIRTNEP